jgi:hypothetical protein
MPLKNGHLTPKERVWSEAFAATGDAAYAAWKAEYSMSTLAMVTHRNKSNPAVMADVRRRRAEKAATAAEEGLDITIETMRDKTHAPKVRLEAIRMVWQTDKELNGADALLKDAHEMTGDEIQAVLTAAHAELARRAGQAIDITPEQEPDTADSSIWG